MNRGLQDLIVDALEDDTMDDTMDAAEVARQLAKRGTVTPVADLERELTAMTRNGRLAMRTTGAGVACWRASEEPAHA